MKPILCPLTENPDHLLRSGDPSRLAHGVDNIRVLSVQVATDLNGVSHLRGRLCWLPCLVLEFRPDQMPVVRPYVSPAYYSAGCLLDFHATSRRNRRSTRRHLLQERRGYVNFFGKHRGGATLASFDKCFQVHSRSLSNTKPRVKCLLL